jgi:hypothetical protein
VSLNFMTSVSFEAIARIISWQVRAAMRVLGRIRPSL